LRKFFPVVLVVRSRNPLINYSKWKVLPEFRTTAPTRNFENRLQHRFHGTAAIRGDSPTHIAL
jgi:hypothetical protein